MRTIDFVQRSNGERSKSSLPGMGAGVAGDDGSDEEDPTTKLLGTSSVSVPCTTRGVCRVWSLDCEWVGPLDHVLYMSA